MFLSLFNRGSARADASDRSPWGDFWFTSTGSISSTGMRIDADQAMRLSAVYACVRVLAESFAVLPFRLYKAKAGGGRTPVTSHWLNTLFCGAPNPYQTPFEWREMLQAHLVLRGNAFCEIVEDGRGGISALMPLHPDRVRIESLPNGSFRYRCTDGTGVERVLLRTQVWHLRGLSGDGLMGMSPIQVQAEAIASALAAQDYSNRFFANDAKPTGGWIGFAGKISDEAARTSIREGWQSRQSGANRGKTAVLDMGMEYHEVGVSNKDSQFLESRAFSVTEVARIFRVPPHMIADLSKATFSNIEQQSLEFVSYTMTPWAGRWESSIKAALLGVDSDLQIDFDFSVLLRGDSAGRSAYYHSGILDGWMTRNEARDREGMDPLAGLDEPLRPLNMVEESAAEQQEEEAPPLQTSALPTQGGQDQSAARLRVLVRGNSARLARRLCSGADVPVEVLAEALAITPAAAADWLSARIGSEAQSEMEIFASLVALGGME